MTSAEDLVRTDSEVAALQKLRDITGESGGPMERHSLRVFLIADRLATVRDATIDREVLLIAGLLHDIGLYDEASHGGAYVRDGAEFTAGLLREQGWDQERIRLCFDAIERHHELRSQWDRGAEVELIRRADLVDLTYGLVRFDASREWLRDLFRSVSRDGTYPTIGGRVARQLIHRPLRGAVALHRAVRTSSIGDNPGIADITRPGMDGVGDGIHLLGIASAHGDGVRALEVAVHLIIAV